MNFGNLALKNLWRRPVRTGLTVLGVALAVAVAVSLGGFNLGYKRAISNSIERLGFQVMIMAKGCPYEAATMMLKGGTGLLYLPEDTKAKIETDASVSSITPIFVGVAEKEASSIRDDAAKSFAIVNGIERESFVTMKPWVRFQGGAGYDGGRWFSDTAETEIVLGFEVAEYEQRKVGDDFYMTVTPNGAVAPVQHKFKVVGVLERTGSQDDGGVFVPLKTAQKLFGRANELTIVGVKLKEFSGVKLREFEGRWLKLPEVQVVSLEQVKGTLVSLVGTAQAMIAAVALIAVVVAAIGVMNSIVMSVYERTGEIGVMKAVGASRADIFRLVWLETLLLCVVAGAAGCLLAVVGSGAVEGVIRRLIDLGVSDSLVLITPALLGAAMLGAVVLGLVTGIWPAWRAASLHPVEAIREGE